MIFNTQYSKKRYPGALVNNFSAFTQLRIQSRVQSIIIIIMMCKFEVSNATGGIFDFQNSKFKKVLRQNSLSYGG